MKRLLLILILYATSLNLMALAPWNVFKPTNGISPNNFNSSAIEKSKRARISTIVEDIAKTGRKIFVKGITFLKLHKNGTINSGVKLFVNMSSCHMNGIVALKRLQLNRLQFTKSLLQDYIRIT